MAHVSSVWERDPAHAGYVLEERRCGYVVGGVKLAVIDKCGYVDLGQARDTGPVSEGPGTVQR